MNGGLPPLRTVERPPPIPVATRVPFVFVHINKCAGSSVEIALGLPKRHQTAKEMRAALGHKVWSERLSFAVVRNPFDRVVSIYHHRASVGAGGLCAKPLPPDDWVAAVWRDRDPRYDDGSVLLRPAADWISGGGEIIVEQILRFERLDHDWAALARRLMVAPVLGRWNVNPHPPYREVLSHRSRALIEDVFAEDLDRFDYAF